MRMGMRLSGMRMTPCGVPVSGSGLSDIVYFQIVQYSRRIEHDRFHRQLDSFSDFTLQEGRDDGQCVFAQEVLVVYHPSTS